MRGEILVTGGPEVDRLPVNVCGEFLTLRLGSRDDDLVFLVHIFQRNKMAQPIYRLKDDMTVCAKHMRDERVRNDLTYATKTNLEEFITDTITHSNG